MEQAGARTMQVGRGAQRGVEGDALARCDVLLLLPFLQMETLQRGKRKGIKKADGEEGKPSFRIETKEE